MKAPYASDVDRKLYNEIIDVIEKRCSFDFQNLRLSDDIANTIIIRILKDSIASTIPTPTPEYVLSLYNKAVEDVFEYLQKSSYGYSLSKTHDPELSLDVSQEAIHELLKAKGVIKDVCLWLKQVTHNMLCKHYQNKNKEQELLKSLSMEYALIQSILWTDEPLSLEGLNQNQTQDVLSSPEYAEYETVLAFSNTSSYAAHLNVSYKVAQKRKARVIRNLRSRILLALGWETGRDILNYHQYLAIQKFIRMIQSIGSAPEKDPKRSNRKGNQEIDDLMQGISRIDDWGVSIIGNGRFRFHIFHLTPENRPIVATMILSVNDKNSIKIESCKRNEIVGVHPIPAKTHIPKEIGRSIWSYEKIISLLES